MAQPSSSFIQYKRSVASQPGEDGIIEHIFSILKPANRLCVEFGAGDGKYDSNTWNLIHNHGWSAVLIESHPGYFSRLRKEYKTNPNVQAFNLVVNFQGEHTLDNILDRAKGVPKNIDFLSIDIDGNDYHIWDSLVTYRPRVIMIECNLRIPPSLSFIQPRDLSISWGSSLKALVELGTRKGYELIYAKSMNAIFVLKELFPLFNIADNAPETIGMFSEQDAKFFQLFDGSIVLENVRPHNILLFKKKPRHPIFVYNSEALIPVPFRKRQILRVVKNLIKKIPFYYKVADSIVARVYGKKWQKEKRTLRAIK